jgi:hypothetical protein
VEVRKGNEIKTTLLLYIQFSLNREFLSTHFWTFRFQLAFFLPSIHGA